MVKKILVLATNTYPYGFGESFLETEIDYLAETFEQIVILPFRKANYIRKLPKNAKVENVLTEKSRIYIFLKFFIRTLCSKEFRDELISFRFNKRVLNFVKILFFYCKSLFIKNLVEIFVEDQKLEYKNIIFYTYWLTSSAYGLSLLKQKYPIMKLASRAHGYDLYTERYFTGYIPMQFKTISRLDKLFLISNDGYRYLCNKYEGDRHIINKLMVSRLGVKKGFPVKQGKKPDSPFVIVTCSSLIQVKRVDLLIKALSVLDTKSKRKIEWHHIGGGKEQQALEKMSKNNLFQQVSYQFHGVLTNRQVLKLYKNIWFDLFINVSDSEGIPVSIMEAFSFGIPVVARNVGGNSEIVNNENGLLLDAIVSPEKLAETLLEEIKSQDGLLKKRKVALDFWETTFNAETNYKQFVKYLIHL